MLMHGCKEGQCASCKSFVLDGDDFELDKYSTFALPDYERDEGFTLLCRTHVYEDLTIELLNYDEEMIRSGLPIQQAVTEVVSIDPVTPRHAARRARACGAHASSSSSPGSTSTSLSPAPTRHASFSMANMSSRDSGQLEFVIRVYPDGLFSRLPGHRAGRRRPARRRRAVRCLHAPRGPRQRPDLRRRRCRHGADPVPAAVAGRARHHPQGHLLLRRAAPRRTCASRRSCAPSRRRCRVSATCRRCRSRPRTTLGGRGRLHHRRRATARGRARRRRRVRVWPTTDGRGGHRRCSPIWAYRRNASTTTSSPRLVKPIPLQR